MYKAILRSMGSKYVAYAVQFASLVILARTFPPEIFGKVATIQVFLIFFQLIAEGGLSPAIIGLTILGKKERNGIFGLIAISGAFLGASFYVLSPVLIKFYAIPDLSIVVPYAASGLVFSAVAILPAAFLQRQQLFLKLAIAGVVAEIAGLVAVFLVAVWSSPLQALSVRMAITPLASFVMVYFFSGSTEFGRPKLGANYSAIKPLLRVSSYQLAFNFLNYFSRNLDKILIGKYLGPLQLGIYDRSYALMRYPLQLLTFAMAPAIQPALREHAGDAKHVCELHLDLTWKLSIIGVFFAAIIYFLADQIVGIFFGVQWAATVPIIKILALTVPVQIVLSTSGSFFQTFQRTDLLFRCGVFSSIINVAAIIYGVHSGDVLVLCWALFVSFHLNFFQAYYVLHKKVFMGGYRRFMIKMIAGALGVSALTTWHIVFSH